MLNTTTKKQNKILLAALVIILAAAAILIGITSSANKKEKNDTPPLDNSISDKGSESDSKSDTMSTITPNESEKDTESQKTPETNDKVDESDSEKNKETEKDTEKTNTDAPVIQQNVLPTFKAPVDSFVIKEHSDSMPVFSYTMNDYRVHNGPDFACSKGTPVCAAADGVVCEVTDDPMMGVTIALQHSGNAVTRYSGLSEESMSVVKVGNNIPRGSVIGSAGDTALIESAEESHIHFELLIGGEQKDPADYMKVTFLSDLTED